MAAGVQLVFEDFYQYVTTLTPSGTMIAGHGVWTSLLKAWRDLDLHKSSHLFTKAVRYPAVLLQQPLCPILPLISLRQVLSLFQVLTLSHCLLAETRLGASPSYQAVWAEPVRPLWLSRGVMHREPLCLCKRLKGRSNQRGRRACFCPDSQSASRAKARGALSRSSNGLPAINNPLLYSAADQTKIHCSYSRTLHVF